MSPPPISGKQRDSGLARLLGSGTSGITELLLFHPVDTLAKRMMSNKSKSISFNQIVFKDHFQSTPYQKFVSLFPGLGYAAGYKILQRIYKFGGQPYFKDYLNRTHRNSFTKCFGEKNGKAMMEATAGSLTGIGEIVLLPLDVLKIKRQVFKIVADEGFALYRGWGWTAARNAPGSFALFGGSAFTKEYLFKLQDYSSATWSQNFVCSIAGSVSSIAISQPLDVIKTRVQNQNFESKQGGMMVIKDIMKNEGLAAFFKGLTPKVLVVGPKLIFSFTMAQSLIPMFGKYV
ncbi:mitochondrial carrier domain-containing protein [Melampsora americana]|nr:mitochondrial carrier domain-containing protein [Melampsora americana]